MPSLALFVVVALGTAAEPAECRNPPSRASDAYWGFIDACGCARLDPPSRASHDHERFLEACSGWRERNRQVEVIVAEPRPADAAASARPAAPATPAECREAPSRVSDDYWAFIDACGCADLAPPAQASDDYARFLKACSQWRERNPRVDVIVPTRPPGEQDLPW